MPLSSFYQGRGRPEPKMADALPTVNPQALRRPDDYRATPRLAAAVDVALTLGMPLLLTGEPGSGKSGLADSLAWELGLGEVLRFPVKSDTESRDLFYRFDTVGRFHAAQTAKDDAATDPARFITFEALGRAILEALSPEERRPLGLPEHALDPHGAARRSVVLIDEIDKAPRDVPNDILVEIEQMQFDIPELIRDEGRPVRIALAERHNRYRPIVVFTSNSEKALPDPFLRRCVYHNLSFPPFRAELPGNDLVAADQVTVESIVAARLGARFQGQDEISERVRAALGLFRYLRSEASGLERRPPLAELLDWLDHLMPQWCPPSQWTALAALSRGDDPDAQLRLETAVATLLLKKQPDQARAAQLLADWRAQANRRT